MASLAFALVVNLLLGCRCLTFGCQSIAGLSLPNLWLSVCCSKRLPRIKTVPHWHIDESGDDRRQWGYIGGVKNVVWVRTDAIQPRREIFRVDRHTCVLLASVWTDFFHLITARPAGPITDKSVNGLSSNSKKKIDSLLPQSLEELHNYIHIDMGMLYSMDNTQDGNDTKTVQVS